MKTLTKQSAVGPYFGLVTFWFAMEYLRPQDYIAALGFIRPSLILLVVMASVWLARADKSILKDKLIVGYMLFITLGVVSVFFARNNYWAAMRNLDLIAFFAGGVLPFIAFMDRPESLKRFFGWWLLFNSLVAVAALIRGGRGSGGFMGDENDLALTMATALPFAYFLATQCKRAQLAKGLLVVACLLMIAAIVATRSRGGFLGMTTAGFAIILFSQNRIRNLVAVGIITGLAAIALTQAKLTDPLVQDPNDPHFRQRHEQSYMDEMRSIQDATDSTRRSRFYFWGRSWEMFKDNPILGVGTSNFGWRVEDYEKRDPSFVGDRAMSGGRVAHSIYFTLLAEYGLVGTTVFAFLMVGLWKRLGKTRRRLARVDSAEANLLVALAQASSASLLAFLVSGAFLTVIYYPHFWYLLGFAITLEHAAARLVPEEVRRPLFGHTRLGSSPSGA